MQTSFSFAFRNLVGGGLALAALSLAGAVATGCGRSDLADYIVALDDGGSIEGGDDVTPDAPSADGSDGGVCGPFTCPFGCCSANGVCQPGFSVQACGQGGFACTDCIAEGFDACDPASHACSIQTQGCGPENCKGCCVGDVCFAGSASTSCGVAGEACSDCAAAGEVCANGFCQQPTCGPGNCPGCCFGNLCEPGVLPTACGTNGQQCIDCVNFGDTCQGVGPGGVCVQQACGPNNCKGCCQGLTCMGGTSSTACGLGGQECADCALLAQTCTTMGQCVPPPPECNAANCAGCCDASGTCQPGFVDALCGQNGAMCQDCSALQSTCDVSVSPRTCASEQMQCPTSYPSCNPSLMETGPATEQVCSSTDLSNGAAACEFGAQTSGCQEFFAYEETQHPACGACLGPFDYDFSASLGLIHCVTPFLSSTCNHELACLVDCIGTTCSHCQTPADLSQCQSQAETAQCSSFSDGATCAEAALFSGPGSFCAPTSSYGSWLQTVGSHYCLQ